VKRPLTLETLRKLGACAVQFQRFALTFGESVDVTPELCVSVADEFDWEWAVRRLLSPDAQAEYKRVRALARAEYEHVCDSAHTEYKRVWSLYTRAYDSAWAKYKRVCAETFGRLYASGGAA